MREKKNLQTYTRREQSLAVSWLYVHEAINTSGQEVSVMLHNSMAYDLISKMYLHNKLSKFLKDIGYRNHCNPNYSPKITKLIKQIYTFTKK